MDMKSVQEAMDKMALEVVEMKAREMGYKSAKEFGFENLNYLRSRILKAKEDDYVFNEVLWIGAMKDDQNVGNSFAGLLRENSFKCAVKITGTRESYYDPDGRDDKIMVNWKDITRDELIDLLYANIIIKKEKEDYIRQFFPDEQA